MFDSLLRGDYASAPLPLPLLALSLLLALALGQIVAWTYMLTHDGLSYSRAFVVSIALMPMIVALVMMVLTNSLVAAFGMMAVFAIVRFRNIVRDTLDTVHILAAIVLGLACGAQKFTTAVFGGVLVVATLAILRWSDFGRRRGHDYVVHLRSERIEAERADVRRVLERHGSSLRCVSGRPSEDGLGRDFTYHLTLRDPARERELVRELERLPEVKHVGGMPVAEESEV